MSNKMNIKHKRFSTVGDFYFYFYSFFICICFEHIPLEFLQFEIIDEGLYSDLNIHYRVLSNAMMIPRYV